MNANDTEHIKSGKEDLQKACLAVSEKMYQQAAPQGGPAPPAARRRPDQGGADGNVYDADYKEVDDGIRNELPAQWQAVANRQLAYNSKWL